ncbi:hypothetical protein MVLG_06652 [Microbotryum lychnidis-dioicae p1A1 Lamole]|uniref:Uncharacterized protein n=1 Tax=Microbotryum lychnidis-dioicae (strain p1A1 Lamole / MvSl-1064) TaxID=683840 RepID=U5HHY2_USTV1|nr:hypothetical protein MVLG_06652 [Microbotryum lychnidis-dioicae p1A1 Lamole]|eukprot:KDE02815.1 hypothetical protein MVLG_06652 [Microbotryum lychnidis-dioicae p1A1 Lamole]
MTGPVEIPLRDEEMTEASATTNATSNTRRRRAAQSVLRTPVSQRFSTENVLSHVLSDTKVELSLGMLLAASPDLSKGVAQQCQRRRVPINSTTAASGVYNEMTEDAQDEFISNGTGREQSGLRLRDELQKD